MKGFFYFSRIPNLELEINNTKGSHNLMFHEMSF
jgi:hypothetical protein